ncbi:uncharacterized protein LOC144115066 isoform X2 [Amblyomma americanum]
MVVCTVDMAEDRIRCDYCDHSPSSHSRIADLGPIMQDTEQQNNASSSVLSSSQPGCCKDSLPWTGEECPVQCEDTTEGRNEAYSSYQAPVQDAHGMTPTQAVANQCTESLRTTKCLHTSTIASAKDAVAPAKKYIPVVEKSNPEVTKEMAIAKLQLFVSDTLSSVTYNTERVMCRLKVTFQHRCQHYVHPLPSYFLVEDILCAEAQLRFGSTVDELEVRLKEAAQVFSEKQGQDTSLVEISRHLQDSMDHFLITETALPTAIQVTAPHVYTDKNQSWIYGGTQAEVIALKDKNIEWAVIICLRVYYLKILSYPRAFSQTLILCKNS